jgi:hypothetical protein
MKVLPIPGYTWLSNPFTKKTKEMTDPRPQSTA